MTRYRSAQLIGAVAFLGLWLGACGNDDNNDDGALSEAEFIAQAEALCAANNAVIDAKAEEVFGSGDPSPEDLEALYEVIVTNVDELHDKLRALVPPADRAAEWDSILDELDDVNNGVERGGAEAFFAGDGNPWADVNERGTAFGLPTCGQSEENDEADEGAMAVDGGMPHLTQAIHVEGVVR